MTKTYYTDNDGQWESNNATTVRGAKWVASKTQTYEDNTIKVGCRCGAGEPIEEITYRKPGETWVDIER